MSDLNVRLVQLAPMSVISFYGFGPSPEYEAWDKLITWVRSRKNAIETSGRPRIFGFNNPSPSPGSPNYGYEFWVVVSSEWQKERDIEIKEFSGGLYAVANCTGANHIGPTWEALSAWCENSTYTMASHQWLEEILGSIDALQDEDNLQLDLYLPISSQNRLPFAKDA